MKSKGIVFACALFLGTVSICDARYDQYEKVYLKQYTPLKVVASATIQEEGM